MFVVAVRTVSFTVTHPFHGYALAGTVTPELERIALPSLAVLKLIGIIAAVRPAIALPGLRNAFAALASELIRSALWFTIVFIT